MTATTKTANEAQIDARAIHRDTATTTIQVASTASAHRGWDPRIAPAAVVAPLPPRPRRNAVVWGMPVLEEDGPRQDVIYAGCALPAEPWAEQCRACHATFGGLRFGDAEADPDSPWQDLD